MKRLCAYPTGHWIGLDVHDVAEYRVDGVPRELEPGMVMTIEPGLYVDPRGVRGGPVLARGGPAGRGRGARDPRRRGSAVRVHPEVGRGAGRHRGIGGVTGGGAGRGCDVAIAGGGLVGATLAAVLAAPLRRPPLSVTLIDPKSRETEGSDARSLAISHGSARFYRTLGIWDGEIEAAASPIAETHVSRRGRFGVTRLRAAGVRGGGARLRGGGAGARAAARSRARRLRAERAASSDPCCGEGGRAARGRRARRRA